ncbi:hypothetical protein D9611_009432 [Ephemerocybe angulata]|uniref:Protein kinase domain-containing protein n=1 Tax=Ephemerocybe angulata TaxID=980116 RepID=A0A8H5AVV3_9AGAR|nr:hypothetical protein D9611_009432 [Tulosesus angulatus]
MGDARVLAEDSKLVQSTPFDAMLKALIMLKRNREDVDENQPLLHDDELESFGEVQLEELLIQSVEFCNDESRSAKLRARLQEVLQMDNESDRYQPLAIGLNSTLLDFKTRLVGKLLPCIPEDATLYIASQLNNFQSSPLHEAELNKDLQCPGVYEAAWKHHLNALPEDSRDQCASLERVAEQLEERLQRPAEGGARHIGDWSDVTHCVEVRRTQAPTSIGEQFKKIYSLSTIRRPVAQRDQKTSDSPTPSASHTLKRTSEDSLDFLPDSKRVKVCDESLSTRSSTSDLPAWEGHDRAHSMQCALYGTNMLNSRWNGTHAIVSLLEDHWLTLHWYDPQGCIATDPIDIVEQLPLLVAMVVLFQRFRGPMRGVAPIELKCRIGEHEVPYAIPATTRPRWGMTGKRVVATIPLPVAPPPDRPPCSVDITNYFFKWSWRKEDSQSEAEVVDLAKERARRYLPKEFTADLTNHLPKVEHAEDFPLLSTSLIRKYAGIKTPLGHPRVPTLTLSKKLLSVKVVVDPQTLRVFIWDILRCVTLLWRIGIAHGDISLENIMVMKEESGNAYLVLSDFDHAAIMTPGAKTPEKKGFETTGTRPFMAMELLKRGAFGEPVKHSCCHDLESAIWCLPWLCNPIAQWNASSFIDAYRAKLDWLDNPPKENGIETASLILWKASHRTLSDWYPVKRPQYSEKLPPQRFSRKDLRRRRPPSPEEQQKQQQRASSPVSEQSEQHCFDVIEKYFPRGEEYMSWDWIHFEVKPEDVQLEDLTTGVD